MKYDFNCAECIHQGVCMYEHEIGKLNLNNLVEGVMEDALEFSVACKFYKKLETKPLLRGGDCLNGDRK